MSQPCAVAKCIRTSRGLCDCCTQYLCIQHLSEHNASLISQLNPLTDEINALGNRLKTINIQKTGDGGRRKLEQWCMDCHQKIDRIFEQKSKELDQLINEKIKKQHKEIVQIQSKVGELIREQETTRQDIDSLTSTIQHLKEQMYTIEHKCFCINTRPLVIDDSFIQIEEMSELDLSTLSPVCKAINRPDGGSSAISTSDRFLLIHRKPNLCLIDQETNIAKEMLWNHGGIYDIHWSSTLNRFIIVEEKTVFLVDEETLTIDKVQTIEERNWLSCTCSEAFLFLSTIEFASSIVKFKLLPSIELAMKWKSPQTCAQDEIIHHIVYNDGTLGMVINNRSAKSLRMELRSAETLQRIWSVRCDTVCNQVMIFRCCVLTCDEWLVIDYETKRLLHITRDGKLKVTIPYNTIPCCANLFANMLVVSREGGVNFHKL